MITAFSDEQYDKKPYAIERKRIEQDIDAQVSVPRNSTIDERHIATSVHRFSRSHTDQIVRTIEAFMPKIDGKDTSLTSEQKDHLSKCVSDIYAQGYADGLSEGIEEGMFVWDLFLDSPLDGKIGEDSVSSMHDNAIKVAKAQYVIPEEARCGWVSMKLRFDPEDMKRFCGEHQMTWAEGMYWVEAIGREVDARRWVSGPGRFHDRKMLFLKLLYLFDIYELNYGVGFQFYRDTCDFYRDFGSGDGRRSKIDWEAARNVFSLQEIDAFVEDGVPVDDLFLMG